MTKPFTLEATPPRSPAEKDPQLAIALSEVQEELAALEIHSKQSTDLLPYIATPVDEALRQRLQQFLVRNPELDHEAAWSKLLDLGLQKASELGKLHHRPTGSQAARRRA